MQLPSTSSARPIRGPLLLDPDAELARLDAHFTRTLSALHRASTRGLKPSQRRARARHLEELARYQRRGRFPQNRLFRGRAVPHFIDAAGTRCAMGHLIERAGGADLVHHVARHRNYATIAELADTPELLAWLEENGLTVGEAGLIQPSYCGRPSDCVCAYLTETVYEGDLTVVAGEPLATLLVTNVHGASTGVLVGQSIDAYPGNAADKDHVLATPGEPTASVAMVVQADGTIDVETCLLNLPVPADLPKATAIAALTSPNAESCGLELAKADPTWNELQGDCGSTSSASSSAASTGSASATTTSSSSTGSGSGGGGGEADIAGSGCAVGGGSGGAELALALVAGVCALRRRRG